MTKIQLSYVNVMVDGVFFSVLSDVARLSCMDCCAGWLDSVGHSIYFASHATLLDLTDHRSARRLEEYLC